MDLEVATAAKIPVLGTTVIVSHTVFLVVLDGSPGAPTAHQDVCHLEARQTKALAKTRIPQRFIDSLKDRDYPVHLALQDDGGWGYQADLPTQYIGYDPGITGDVLPQNLGDKGLIDWDGDGVEGATVALDAPLFGEVEVYMAQRGQTSLRGAIQEDGSVAGRAEVRDFHQRTVGASNRLFKANPTITPDWEKSSFAMKKAPAGSTCKDLMAAHPPAGG